MGYYPSDMMSEYLSEHTFILFLQKDEVTGVWSFEEDEDEALVSLLEENDELKFDPHEKLKEILAAKPETDTIYVFYTGEWFESTEEAFLYLEEKETLQRMLWKAYEAGGVHTHNEEGEFADLWTSYTHGGTL